MEVDRERAEKIIKQIEEKYEEIKRVASKVASDVIEWFSDLIIRGAYQAYIGVVGDESITQANYLDYWAGWQLNCPDNPGGKGICEFLEAYFEGKEVLNE